MTDSKARVAEPSLFQGLVNSPVREATRRATRHFCFNLLASAKIGRSISTLAACIAYSLTSVVLYILYICAYV